MAGVHDYDVLAADLARRRRDRGLDTQPCRRRPVRLVDPGHEAAAAGRRQVEDKPERRIALGRDGEDMGRFGWAREIQHHPRRIGGEAAVADVLNQPGRPHAAVFDRPVQMRKIDHHPVRIGQRHHLVVDGRRGFQHKAGAIRSDAHAHRRDRWRSRRCAPPGEQQEHCQERPDEGHWRIQHDERAAES